MNQRVHRNHCASSLAQVLTRAAWLYLLAALSGAPAHAEEAPWVLVDTATATLSVMWGQSAIVQFTNISFGRDGTGRHRQHGENKTPLGVYRISWIETQTPFYRFFGLNYPTLPHAYWARTQGIINQQTYQRILKARKDRRRPPQNTRLGGNIGIHGLGDGDPWIHANLHWTNGCVALTNEQIDRLSEWLEKGTQVIIQ